MSGSWQIVPDENEEDDPRISLPVVDLRRVGGGLVVVLLVVAALTPPMLDQSIGVCRLQTGSMNVARVGHTATLLPSGKVLVAGGWAGLATASFATASAELYDPATGTWSLTGPMKSARAGHVAALLRSGKVLVAGGVGSDTSRTVASAELYDPVTGLWTETGDVRAGGSSDFGEAVVLRSGEVFVSLSRAGDGIFSAQLYDPVSGSWSAIGSSGVDPGGHPGSGSTTLLGSGNVLVLNGLGLPQLYDPVNGAWKLAGSMTTRREWHTATLLPSGRVLVAGGYVSFPHPISSAEIYDPVTDVWSPTSSMPAPTLGARATLLPSGKVLVAGGGVPGPYPDYVTATNLIGPRASINIYDPATDSWTAAGAMAAPRSVFTATLLRSGALLFVGGAGMSFAADGPFASAEIYALTCPSR